ncbi:MAG: hypothetical protein AAGU27_00035 [Dehalobacterium sp.]
MTPATSIAAALLHSNDWIDPKSVLKIGAFVLIMVVGSLVGNLMF